MKHLNITFLLFVLLCIMCSRALAYDIAEKNADGVTIYYNYINNNTKLEVTDGNYSGAYSGIIIIPSVVSVGDKTLPVTVIGDGAFFRCPDVISIKIPNSVTTIDPMAFSGCTGLTSIEIPNSVTSIGNWAFEECMSLASIEIPNSVTSIGDGVFYGCTSLSSIAIDCQSVGSWFRDLTSIEIIKIGNNVTSISDSAFKWCTGLTTIDINCQSVGSWFSGLTSVKTIKIGNNVTSIGERAFEGCSGLTSIEIPNSLTSIGKDAFYDCNSIKTVNRFIDVEQWFENDPIKYANNDSNPMNKASEIHLFMDTDTEITNLIIPNGVTAIRSDAFAKCTGLKSVTIPNSVTSISDSAFNGCTGLTTIDINCQSVGSWFRGLTSVNTITLGNNVTSIGSSAFSGCTGLNSVCLSQNITTINNSAFHNCNVKDVKVVVLNLSSFCNNQVIKQVRYGIAKPVTLIDSEGKEIKEYNIPDKITTIGDYAFSDCRGLTSVTIPQSINTIGNYAFAGCTGLSSIVIPNSVTGMGDNAFSECSGLTSVKIEDGMTALEFKDTPNKRTFNGCPLVKLYLGRNIIIDYNSGYSPFERMGTLKDVTIGNKVTGISYFTFYGCIGLTSIDIPNGITDIGEQAFQNCTGLTSVVLPSSVTSIGQKTFYGCSSLSSISIPSSVISIGNSAFSECGNMSTVELYCKEIGTWFSGMTSIKNVKLGVNVTTIRNNAFSGCSNMKTLVLPDNVTSIGANIFKGKLLVNKGTKTLLSLWNYNQKNARYAYSVFDKTGEQELLPPAFNVATTQTTATVKFDNVDLTDGFTYSYNGEQLKQTEIKYTTLKPESKQDLSLVISKEDLSYTVTGNCTTKGLNPRVDNDQYEVTASSIRAKGTYTEEDAKVVAQRMFIMDNYSYNNNKITNAEGAECYAFGLNPGRSYTVVCEIDVDYGGTETATYSGTRNIYTQSMRFSTAAPKVVSRGNAVVSATVNLDENEENVGFEWRCVDWTNEFPSNTGTAILYDGVIEGYIKELNTEKLWKFRPYYLSNTGTYHYGDWMGLDPTNTSYFEPTVRTYAKININGNTALVRGYVLSGSDDIVVKGFKYWRTGVNMHTRGESVPEDAITVEATGQQTMSANLKGLEYNSTYHYIAFATTSTGETYYGDEQVFATPLASAKYATFYDSQSAYRLPAGLTASVVTGVNNGKLVYKVIADGAKSNNVVPKGVAVMLTSEKGEPSDYTMTLVESGETYTGENWLKGSDNTTTTTGTNCLFYKLSYGPSGTERSAVFGWYWGAANGGAFKIEGHKAWLAVPKSAGVKTRGLEIEGETLGVEELEKSNVEELHTEDAWYMIDGRKLNGVPTSAGIYINQGKKYIIK